MNPEHERIVPEYTDIELYCVACLGVIAVFGGNDHTGALARAAEHMEYNGQDHQIRFQTHGPSRT